MKLSENYLLEDFVSKEIADKFGNKAIWFIDRRIVICLEMLRKYLKTDLVVNTWNYPDAQLEEINKQYGTSYNIQTREHYRGFREHSCTVGAIESQHRFGRAVDFDAIGLTAEQVRDSIRINYPS